MHSENFSFGAALALLLSSRFKLWTPMTPRNLDVCRLRRFPQLRRRRHARHRRRRHEAQCGFLLASRGPAKNFRARPGFSAREARRGQNLPTLPTTKTTPGHDFVENQINPWGDVPFFLGIGNHETTKPKSREAFVQEFHHYLNRPELKEQRLKDDPKATQPRTYFHWIRDGIDFIYLDNATKDQFDAAQMKWIEGVLNRDRKDESIRTLVVGMHEALPESISSNHSMNEYPSGIETGRRVYTMLLKMQNDAHKTVYVLCQPFALFYGRNFQHSVLESKRRGVAGMDRRNRRRRALSSASRLRRCQGRQDRRLWLPDRDRESGR